MRQPVPFGKYLLLDRISVGGMAEVFKAKSYGVEGFEKVIAIKRILPSMGEDQDFITMFIDEAKIAGQLSHANICQIFELGRHDGHHFIAMEYIWGKDLLQMQNRLRKQNAQMPVAMACHIVAKVAEGLDYAHRKRDPMGRPLEIVHRDCSPQNILVSYEGEVKIIDFGIARAASRSARTNAGVLKGKFGYMSPEQVRGLPLDRRSDLFAIGTVFYESLTGERLFQGESDFSTLERVRNADVQPPSGVNADIPAEVERIVLKCLARDPSDRYQTGAELHADLRAYLTKQDQAFTSKSLADWIKSAFAGELERERQRMEEYKRIGRDGLIAGAPQAKAVLDVVHELGEAGSPDGDPTQLGPPDLPGLDAQAAKELSSARGKVVRSGQRSDDFDDEGPTEIFGEIGDVVDDMIPEQASERASQPTILADEAGQLPGVIASPSALTPSSPGQSSPGQLAPSSPGQSSPGQMSPPARPAVPSGQGASHPGMPHPPPYGSYPGGPAPAMSSYPAQPSSGKRASVGRDVAIGCAIVALVLAAFVSAKFLVFDDDPSANAKSAEPAVGTLAVMIDGDEPAQVEIDGKAVGEVRADAPLTLNAMEPGQRVVRVTRAGVPPCEQTVDVVSDKIELIRCPFEDSEPDKHGTLALSGIDAEHRVFVDDQEISSEAAREPIPLTAGAEHRVAVKSGETVVAEFAVAVKAGEAIERVVEVAKPEEVAAERKPPVERRPEPRPESRPEPRNNGPGASIGLTGKSGKSSSSTSGKSSASTSGKSSGSSSKGSGSSAKPVDGAARSTSNQKGSFTAFTKPWARVYIDGKDTGKMTPIVPRSAIELSPGKHRVTFVVGDKKFNYTVRIEPGKRKNLVKVLPVD